MKVRVWLKKTLFWVIAIIITLGAAVFQRLTGPTYPLNASMEHNGEVYRFDLPRSHGGETDCVVELDLPESYTAKVLYRRYPTNDPWVTMDMYRMDSTLIVFLPNQPPAGKLEYHVEIYHGEELIETDLEENVVVRFKGEVPSWALIPHVIFMFLAMLWSNATGLQAAVGLPSYKRNAWITIGLFTAGGLILGPIVQKFAFGAYWTGWPFGEDLTDNKVLASVIIWVVAILLNRKKERPWLIIIAAIFLFAIYMIPHSMRGSELDYGTGNVITGSILLVGLFFSNRKSTIFGV